MYLDEHQDEDDIFDSIKNKLVNKEKIIKKKTSNAENGNTVEMGI